jgi:lipid-binding SYLF domain-containing protein
MRWIQLVLALSLLALAACTTPMGERMGQSVAVLNGFRSSDHAIPETVFENAKAIAIIREGSGALIVGGSGGDGLFMKRTSTGWTAPVAINTGGATIGLQAGAQSRDIVIFMNKDEEIANFLDDGLYGVAEASAVAGPAKTDPNNAGGPVPATYYYLRTEGIFGGLLVGGVHFSVSDKANAECYGEGTTPGDILEGKVKPAPGTTVLWQSLN